MGSWPRATRTCFRTFSPDEFRVATEEAKKQRRVGKFDTVVLKRVLAAQNLGRVDLLHPGMMYRLFMPFWREIASMSRVEQYAAYARIDAADDPVLRALPDTYVAVRFYFSRLLSRHGSQQGTRRFDRGRHQPADAGCAR